MTFGDPKTLSESIAVGTLALLAIAKLGKPVAKAMIKRGLAVSPAPTSSYRPVEAKFPTTSQEWINSQNRGNSTYPLLK